MEREDAPQDGVISSERVIESSGQGRRVRDAYERSSPKLLNDDVVLRLVLVDGWYVPSPSSSFHFGTL